MTYRTKEQLIDCLVALPAGTIILQSSDSEGNELSPFAFLETGSDVSELGDEFDRLRNFPQKTPFAVLYPAH